MKKLLLTFGTLLLAANCYAASTATCFDTDTKAMLHMNGADLSTTFTDSSTAAHTFTAEGNAKLSTTSPKFGTAAGLFDGTTDDLTSANSADWNLGTGDFTIDLQVKFTNLPTAGNIVLFVAHYTSGSYATDGSYLFFIDNTAGTYSLVWESYQTSDSTFKRTWTTPVTGTWYHLTAAKSSGTVKLFVDGTQLGADISDSHDLTQTTTLTVGADSAGLFSLDGRIDELRFVKGTAVWTANFTAPSAEYTQCSTAGHNLLLLGAGA